MSTKWQKWYEANKERRAEYNKAYKDKHRARYNEQERARQQRLRIEIVSRYSKGIPKCACCGETQIRFLSLDHINGKQGRKRKRTGSNLYAYLKRTPIDPNLQVLCYNCNLSKGFYGQCPHKV